jgi:putative hydrolase of the HAD superfamily
VDFDIAQLKQRHAAKISWRPEAENFLRRLRASHCEVVLITNAHPDTLRIKLEQVQLEPWLDKVFTSHGFKAPKEYQTFWQKLQAASAFEPQRTLFIDDSESVLVSAETYGVAHLITLRQPDSSQSSRTHTRYPAILHFDELFEGLPHFDR